jgi:hypothetical protein
LPLLVLNLDKPDPHSPFTIVIFDELRSRFVRPEEKFRNKDVCVTGRIQEFRGAPAIIVSDPKQITDWKK